MLNDFLGITDQTPEEIERLNRLERILAFYNLPVAVFDGDGENLTQRQKDKLKAWELILVEQPLPVELEERLLKYKEDDLKVGRSFSID